MAIAALGVGFLFRTRARRWLGVQTAALVAGGLLYFLLFYLVGDAAPQFASRLQEIDEGSRRLQQWATTMEMAAAHPWLGAGPQHFAWAPFRLASGAHPHNALVQWLAEWGVPSTVIMSGLVLWGGGRWLQQERKAAAEASASANAVRVGLVAAGLAGAAHAMVSGLLVMPVSQTLLALVGGWAWGRYQPAASASAPTPPRRAHVLLCVALLAATVAVGYSLQDLSTIEARRSAFLETVDRNRFSPRYWAQGYIGVREVDSRARTR